MTRKARARMLASTISTSERVNLLSLKAALIYTWLISHADDQGRLSGDAETIKALVVPLRKDISVEDVERALSDMEDVALIQLYSPDTMEWTPSRKILQINDWTDYQRLRDPQASKYPAPKGWRDRVGKQSRDERGRYSNE